MLLDFSQRFLSFLQEVAQIAPPPLVHTQAHFQVSMFPKLVIKRLFEVRMTSRYR